MMCPIYMSWVLFPENKGLASGIVIAGFGFGSFIFNFITTALVNPLKLKIDPQTQTFPPEVFMAVP